jgi:hypothetical protein
MIKGFYKAKKAFGVVDLGYNWKEQGFDTRFAIVEADLNNDGILDEAEKEAINANLYSIAVNSGAEPIKNGAKIISVNRCLEFKNPSSEFAKNDKAYVFNKGDKIFLTTRYEDKDGNVYEIDEDGLTDLSFDQIKFLNEYGLIE